MNVFVLTVFLLLAGGYEVLACRDDWVRLGDYCYAFIDEKVTWSSAVEICRTLNARLVEIDNEDENTFLTSTIKSKGFLSVWTGVNDFLREGTYLYSSNLTPVTYTRWRAGEPNNLQALEQSQDCVILTHTGEWDDYFCDNTHTTDVVCEYVSEAEVIG